MTRSIDHNSKNHRPAYWMPRAGDVVDYHSVIGKPATHIGYTVTNVGLSGAGIPVAWMNGISGFVSVDALTPNSPMKESHDENE